MITDPFDNSPMVVAKVRELLSSQFTAVWWELDRETPAAVETQGYFLYSDRGQTWKFQ